MSETTIPDTKPNQLQMQILAGEASKDQIQDSIHKSQPGKQDVAFKKDEVYGNLSSKLLGKRHNKSLK